MRSNRYIFFYAIGISLVTAVILAFASEGLRPLQTANIRLDIKTQILRSVRVMETEREALERMYAERVEAKVINHQGETIEGITPEDIRLKDEIATPPEERKMPLYIYTDQNQEKRYVIPMQGTGLWGPIYGYISLEDDFNTVYGAVFSHKSETPGLGAEIAELPFQQQFQGKKIMTEDNTFISVNVVKPTAKTNYSDVHRVDGISGGTITSDGTDQMLENCIKPYLPYFEKLKQES